MHLFTLQILTISTSILAWITISSSCLIQLQHYKKKLNVTTSIFPLLLVLWMINTYTLYELFILCQSLALMPSFSCWSLTLLIPLIYLYYRSQVSGSQPSKKLWFRHLLVPGILALIYFVLPFITSVADKQIYNWTEFRLDYPAWWTIFRISCYLICIIQSSIYTLHLKRSIKTNESDTIFKKGITELILCFCLVYFISNLITGYVFDLLFNLISTMLGGYIIWEKRFNQIIMREFKLSFPHITNISVNLPTRSVKKTPQLNERQKAEVFLWLQKPDFFKSKINLKIIAKDILIAPSVLSIFIKEEKGGSLANLIVSHRLDNAEKFLLDPNQNKSVAEIAEETGFQSSASFYRAFMKRHQISPLKWREQVLRQSDNS